LTVVEYYRGNPNRYSDWQDPKTYSKVRIQREIDQKLEQARECPNCDYAAVNTSNYETHVRRCNMERAKAAEESDTAKVFMCPLCHRQEAEKSAMVEHLKRCTIQ